MRTEFLTYITDVIDNKYIGIKFDSSNDNTISDFLERLKEYVGEDKFTRLVNNHTSRDLRDDYTHHLTVLNVMECNYIIKSIGSDGFNTKISLWLTLAISDLKMLGIGSIMDKEEKNETFYIICESKMLDNIRSEFGLHKRDFHVTLGFIDKDVFDSPKDISTLLEI